MLSQGSYYRYLYNSKSSLKMVGKLGRKKFVYLSVLYIFLFLIFSNFLTTSKSTVAMLNSIIDPTDMSNLDADDPLVVSTLKESFLQPPSLLPYNLSTDEFYQIGSTGYHWSVIYKLLKQLFDKEPPGFFVEAGALDGEFLSNTLFLEQKWGWKGLLIEPEPNNFKDMVYKRRKAWISNSCLSTTRHPTQMDMIATVKKENEPLDPMAIRGGAHFVGSHDKDEGYLKFEKEKLILRKFKCQCFPLFSYLVALNIKTVDFLSLDLQGPEIQIFLTLPFDKIYVRSVVIENENGQSPIDFDFIKIMDDKGFLIVAVGGSPDYFFVNKSDQRLVKTFKDLLSASEGKKVKFEDSKT